MSLPSFVVDSYAHLLSIWPSQWGEMGLFIGASMSAYFLFYWLFVAWLYVFVYSERFPYFQRFKIQGGKHPDSDLVKMTFIKLAVSYVVVQPLFLYALYKYTLIGRMSYSVSSLPSIWSIVWTIIGYHLLMDTWFYWTHRLLHWPPIYGPVHKEHHKYFTPIGLAAAYAHPIEDVFVNAASTFIGPVLFPTHIVTHFLYLCTRYHETVDAHCGYAFPWSLWSWWDDRVRRHDYHHSHGHKNGNFGAFPFWDRICQTDKAYREYRSKQLTLKPNADGSTPTPAPADTDSPSPKDQ